MRQKRGAQPPRGERAALVAVGIGLVGALVLAAASAASMSVGADEAYILLGVQGLAEHGELSNRYGVGATSTGGIYPLVQASVFWLGASPVPWLRLFPLLCFALLLAELFVWGRRAGLSAPGALLGTTVVLAVPGTLTLAGSGYGAVPAILLLLVGVRLCDFGSGSELPTPRKRRYGRVLLAGFVLGIAAATRLQCALVLPALLVGWLPPVTPRTREAGVSLFGDALRKGGPTLIVAGAVLAAAHSTLILLAGDAAEAADLAQRSAGFFVRGTPAFAMKKLVLANSLGPIPVFVVAGAVAFWLERREGAEARRLRVLVAFSWLVLAYFVAVALKSHLRYLWPALASLGCVLGIGLGALYDHGRSGMPLARWTAVATSLACLATGGLATARNLLVGDLNIVTWEWREAIPLEPSHPRARLDPRGDQARMARYLRTLPTGERIGVLDHGAELELLSGRPLYPLRWYQERTEQRSEGLPRRVLTTPHLGRRVFLGPDGERWLKESGQIEVQFGRYVLYEITGQYPANLKSIIPVARQRAQAARSRRR